MFDRTNDTWTQQMKFTADDPEQGDDFGVSVATSGSGETTIIGSPGDDDLGSNSGSTYVFGKREEDR